MITCFFHVHWHDRHGSITMEEDLKTNKQDGFAECFCYFCVPFKFVQICAKLGTQGNQEGL